MCRTCSIDFFYNYDGFVIELIHKFLIFFYRFLGIDQHVYIESSNIKKILVDNNFVQEQLCPI